MPRFSGVNIHESSSTDNPGKTLYTIEISPIIPRGIHYITSNRLHKSIHSDTADLIDFLSSPTSDTGLSAEERLQQILKDESTFESILSNEIEPLQTEGLELPPGSQKFLKTIQNRAQVLDGLTAYVNRLQMLLVNLVHDSLMERANYRELERVLLASDTYSTEAYMQPTPGEAEQNQGLVFKIEV